LTCVSRCVKVTELCRNICIGLNGLRVADAGGAPGVFGRAKAAEDCRTPRRWRDFVAGPVRGKNSKSLQKRSETVRQAAFVRICTAMYLLISLCTALYRLAGAGPRKHQARKLQAPEKHQKPSSNRPKWAGLVGLRRLRSASVGLAGAGRVACRFGLSGLGSVCVRFTKCGFWGEMGQKFGLPGLDRFTVGGRANRTGVVLDGVIPNGQGRRCFSNVCRVSGVIGLPKECSTRGRVELHARARALPKSKSGEKRQKGGDGEATL